MKQIFCPLCNKEMFLLEKETPQMESELIEEFSRRSQVREIKETTTVTLGCECGATLKFDDVNYNISIKRSPEDESVLKSNFEKGYGKSPDECNRKTRFHFEQKYLNTKATDGV